MLFQLSYSPLPADLSRRTDDVRCVQGVASSFGTSRRRALGAPARMHRYQTARVGAERKTPHLLPAQVGRSGRFRQGPCSVHGSLPSCASLACRSPMFWPGDVSIVLTKPPRLVSMRPYLERSLGPRRSWRREAPSRCKGAISGDPSPRDAL